MRLSTERRFTDDESKKLGHIKLYFIYYEAKNAGEKQGLDESSGKGLKSS